MLIKLDENLGERAGNSLSMPATMWPRWQTKGSPAPRPKGD